MLDHNAKTSKTVAPAPSAASHYAGPAPPVEERQQQGPARALPKAGTWRYTFSSLENHNFMYFWLGLLALMAGMQMQMIARSYLAYEITGSPIILGLVNAGFAVPMLAFALYAGAIADRVERKRVIQVTQAVAALLALFVAISITTETVTWFHLYGGLHVSGYRLLFHDARASGDNPAAGRPGYADQRHGSECRRHECNHSPSAFRRGGSVRISRPRRSVLHHRRVRSSQRFYSPA